MKYLGLGAISAAVLLLEITLTRVYSVTQGYHFAFLAVSLGLLGFGVSGTVLFVVPRLWREGRHRLLSVSALLFSVTALGSYWAINRIPFDAYRLVVEPEMYLHLVLYYLAPVVPLFFAGLALGGAITLEPQKAGGLYGSSLVGAGAGSLLALAGPAAWGPSGAMGLVVTLGAVAWWAFARGTLARHLAISGTIGIVLVALAWWLPAQVELRLSPYKSLPQVLRQQGAELEWTGWNPFSRVDVVSSGGLHQAPGLSLAYGQALPHQTALTVDGDNLTSLTNSAPEDAVFTEFLPTAAPFQLLTRPRVLVVEPGGGLDLLTALHHSAMQVTALVGNPLEADLLSGQFAGLTGNVYGDPRVHVVVGNPRAYLSREEDRFDLVVVSLRDAFRPITAGAYSLSEDHLYTKEAFRAYLRQLAPDGLLMATRWVQTPPSEELRMTATVIEAMEELGVDSLNQKLAALRTLQTFTVLAKKEPFTPREIQEMRAFADSRQMDLSYLPGLHEVDLNRFFVIPGESYFSRIQRLLDPKQRQQFYREQNFDIRPTTDDKPFFFHFFRWGQVPDVVAQLGRVWQPFGGAGFLVVLVFLAVSLVVSAVLIPVPLLVRKFAVDTGDESGTPRSWAALAYFFALGLGFLWLELPLMQRFILLLDHPTYSFGVVLFAVLVFSGVGSLVAGRLGRYRGWAILALAAAALLYALGTVPLVHLVLGLPLPARIVIAIASIAPLALLMGIPFPSGVGVLEGRRPGLVPWAWGANGYASVVGSGLAALMALTWGFSAVMLAAAAVYLVAWAVYALALNTGTTITGTAITGTTITGTTITGTTITGTTITGTTFPPEARTGPPLD